MVAEHTKFARPFFSLEYRREMGGCVPLRASDVSAPLMKARNMLRKHIFLVEINTHVYTTAV